MIQEPKKKIHYHKKVWTHEVMDTLRRSDCLCLNCDNINSCPMAKSLFTYCQQQNLALAVTRCPVWKLTTRPQEGS